MALKRTKKEVIKTNQFVGHLAEKIFEYKARFSGKEYKRAPKGQDYYVRTCHVNPLNGKKRYTSWKLIEVKSSKTAPMSRKQKETQKKNPKKYQRKIISLW